MKMDNFWIIITGVVVFIIGQIVQKFILEPLQQYNKSKGEIINSIKLYSHKIFGTLQKEDEKEFNFHFRKLASSFVSAYYMIPCKKIFIKCKVIITKEHIEDISGAIYWIANTGGRFDELNKYTHHDDEKDCYLEGAKFIGKIKEILGTDLI